MSKTHLITQPTTLGAALTEAGVILAADGSEPKSTSRSIDGCFDFIDALIDVKQARRFVMWSMTNALNNSIIGQLMSHLRQERRTAQDDANADHNPDIDWMREHMDEQTLAKYVEQREQIAAMLADQERRFDQGFEKIVPAIDIAETLVNLREFVAQRMSLLATSKRELAQPISESIAFRLQAVPRADEKKVMQIHIATKIPLDVLRKVDLRVKVTERDEMIASMHRVIEIAGDLAWKHDLVKEDTVESTFDTLPVHTRYRMIGAVLRSLKGAMDAEVKALIRFGRMDSVTNRLLIGQTLDGYTKLFRNFGSDNTDALLDYEARGFPLPTLESLLSDKA